jgi:tetratricopeptide (TPR) repeat protein
MNQRQIEDLEYRRQAEEVLANPQDADDQARAFVTLGCVSEHEEDWEAAIANYQKALAAMPQNASLRYFGNNNLGYSLIQLGRFDEAEGYCVAAIEIVADRHNAHKNLGLVHQGQGRWMAAACSFLKAAWLAPRDQRAFRLLGNLLDAHPELLSQSAELKDGVERFQQYLSNEPRPMIH